MRLAHDRHLAYCTNVLRGESWPEIFTALQAFVPALKSSVVEVNEPFAIGLRLSDLASRQLAAEADTRAEFRRWLDEQGCYIFTINGFPYGRFHGGRVKEQVYLPDWTSDARVEYTCRLFELLAEWLPPGVAGSVSTVPGSFKGFGGEDARGRDEQTAAMCRQLRACGEEILRISERSGRALSLALEPEPLCWFENTAETLEFFERLGPGLPVGVCFDTCHFAVEFETPQAALAELRRAGIPISKMHLSSALKVHPPSPEARKALRGFADETYLHQVVIRSPARTELRRYRDLGDVLFDESQGMTEAGEEWRVHFHIPLHAAPYVGLQSTNDELLGALDWLEANSGECQHLEIETYTWEVLPPELRARRVEEQIAQEYAWTLAQLRQRNLAR